MLVRIFFKNELIIILKFNGHQQKSRHYLLSQ